MRKATTLATLFGAALLFAGCAAAEGGKDTPRMDMQQCPHHQKMHGDTGHDHGTHHKDGGHDHGQQKH